MSAKYDTTVTEAIKSLNGFDEIAIERAFGKELDELGGRATVRAVVFVLEKRAGADDKAAKNYAMGVPMGDLDGLFEKSVEEIDEEDPDTEQGKERSASD